MHQDYILRMIQQMSGFVLRVARLREAGRTDEAVAEIDEAYGRFVGLDPALAHALSEEDLIRSLQARGALDPYRTLALAELLRVEGHLLEDAGQPQESFPYYVKALRLYLEALPDLDDLPVDFELTGLDDLLDRLPMALPSASTFALLLAHLEAAGRFARAEDLLWERLDAGDESAPAAAADFYRRLLAKPDADLLAGGLPRAEVEDGLARLGEPGS